MKAIDFDGMFDEKLTEYMEKNKGKYTEKQWENLIPKLYKKFGDTKIKKVGCTPKEYYAKMSTSELVETLKEHLLENVPVSEFLCEEVEGRKEVDQLLPLLESNNEETVSYAINLIGANALATDRYFSIVLSNHYGAEVKDLAVDQLKARADELKGKVLDAYRDGREQESMLEILSKVKERSDEVYETLLSAFLSAKNEQETSLRAGYLASYGDERALDHLLKKIEDRSIGFVEFQELKFAIEALGGQYDEPRDFSGDNDFQLVGKASEKEGFSLIQ